MNPPHPMLHIPLNYSLFITVDYMTQNAILNPSRMESSADVDMLFSIVDELVFYGN
uniref:Uncharacterized protein n=1 Tax=Heterorhabditis bacteriophora TaxID=37862 RepID=A0A1I7WZS1_HETBA